MTALLLLVLLSAAPGESVEETPSPKLYGQLVEHVRNGQYNLAKEDAKRWAALPDVDLALMAKACAHLSNRELHEAAVILLARLDWIRPVRCSWPDRTLRWMEQRGLEKELDRILTHGTWLVAGTDDRRPPARVFPASKTVVRPRRAERLFSFHRKNEGRIERLCARYEAELKKRPEDVGLIAEYAHGLASLGRTDEAAKTAGRIDLTKLDALTLNDLGRMWNWSTERRLVRFSIDPLERASKLVLTDEEARRYVRGGQAVVSTTLARRLFREHVLNDLAQAHVRLERFEEAKSTYERYLELPRRDRWGDRTGVQQAYGKVLRRLGLPDRVRVAMEATAKESGRGRDWAELAAYLQGQGEVDEAVRVWNLAISATPPTPRGFKVERPRESYRQRLIALLDESKRYEEEIELLLETLEEAEDFRRTHILERLAKAHLRADRKADALALLFRELDDRFDIDLVRLILRTDHEKNLFDKWSSGRDELKKLPSWDAVLRRIDELKEPRRSEKQAEFYHVYSMHSEYVDLVERMPQTRVNGSRMLRLVDFCGRCDRHRRAVYWGLAILDRLGEEGFPARDSRRHIQTLEDVSENAAMAGDFDVSLRFAKKLCLLVPGRFYFAEALAKLARRLGKKNDLVDSLEAFARDHPNRWVVWQVLADAHRTWGGEKSPERLTCLREVERLK